MTFSPLSAILSGSGFTPNGSVTINILNQSGTVVGTTIVTADSTGAISLTLDASFIVGSIGSNAAGTYAGDVVAVDDYTNTDSNKIATTEIVTVITPTISLSATSFTLTT